MMRNRSHPRTGAVAGVATALALGFLSVTAAVAGSATDMWLARDSSEVRPGSLRASMLYGDQPTTMPASMAGSRSVPLALGLSAIVPGLGQGYNRQWIKAGIAVAVEALLIVGYVTWRNEGLDGERAFQSLAHTDWSPAKYASWLNDYTVFLELNHGGSFSHEPITVPGIVDFTDPDGWSETDRVTVQRFFADIRDAEFELFHPETGASFSHRIPDFGDQQYYELIGKYFQFAPGWADYPEWLSDGEYTDAIDPERSDADGDKISVSPTFYSYARDHAHSQDLLRRASQVTSLIVVNHVIAAIDAAVFARLHNRRLVARMDLIRDGGGRSVPGATLTLRF